MMQGENQEKSVHCFYERNQLCILSDCRCIKTAGAEVGCSSYKPDMAFEAPEQGSITPQP